MEDPLTDLPPPSRFFAEELNNFAAPVESLALPTPFVAWTRTPAANPKLLIVALSKSACHLVHYLPSKTLAGTLVLPEVSMSGNTLEPSLLDRSCLLYSFEGNPAVILASAQYAVPAERATAWAKALLWAVRPEEVAVAASIPTRHFRGRLSSDETLIFKLETLAARDYLGDVPYFPSGSVIDGAPAALLTQCEIEKLKGCLLVSWPDYDVEVVKMMSEVITRVCPGVDFSVSAKTPLYKALCVDSELYT